MVEAPTLKEALGSLRSVLEDPQRALRLLGNNLLGRIMLGLTLYIILRAIGVTDIGLGRAVVVTVATNLLAGLVHRGAGVVGLEQAG